MRNEKKDFNKIKEIIPQVVIDKVLEKATSDETKYYDVRIIEKEPGRLWRIFAKVLFPFNFRRGKVFNKQISMGTYFFYLMYVLFVGGLFWMIGSVYTEIVFTVLWSIVILVQGGPYITAMYYLMRNKNTYANLGA